MALLSFLALALLPAEPLPEAFAQGEALGREGVKASALSRVLGASDRPARADEAAGPWMKTIGWWFNGRDQSPIEKAVWVSPSFLSRWLGWRSVREGWGPSEVMERWGEAQGLLEERSAFAVVLCSYPKRSLLGQEEDTAPDTGDLERVRIRLEVDGQSVPVMVQFGPPRQARTRQEVEKAAWWQDTPAADFLGGSFDPTPEAGWPLGDYHRRVVWVECAPISEDQTVILSVESPRRSRTARWTPLIRGRGR